MSPLRLLFVLVVFCCCNGIEGARLLLLPEGSASTGGSFTCSGNYTSLGDRCFNTLNSLAHNISSGDRVYIAGTSYTISASSSTYTGAFVNITASGVSFYALTTATLRFNQTSATFSHIITIDANDIYFQGITLDAQLSTGLHSIIHITHSSDNTAQKKSVRSRISFDDSWYYRQEKREMNRRTLSMKRTLPTVNKGSCISCLCGCGQISTPTYSRSNITLFNMTTIGTVSQAQIYADGHFGLLNVIVYNSSLINIQAGEVDDQGIKHHILINNKYVDDGAFESNHYGQCVYPKVSIGFCNETEWLPYYVDPYFNYRAPIETSDAVYAFASLSEAIAAEEEDLVLRGHLYIDETQYINERPLTLTSSDIYSCCATVHVADDVSPAFYAVHETLTLRSLTLSMGNNSGGVIMRRGTEVATDDMIIIKASTVIGGSSVDLRDILSEDTLDVLIDIITPAIVPVTEEIRRVVMDDVHIVNATEDPYLYGLIVTPMDPSAYPNVSITRTSMKGGEYGIIGKHPGINVRDCLLAQSVMDVVINSTGAVLYNDYFIVDDSSTRGIVLNTFNATASAIRDSVFYSNELNATVLQSRAFFPSNITHINCNTKYVVNTDSYNVYDSHDAITSTSTNVSISLGPVDTSHVHIDLYGGGSDNTQYLCKAGHWDFFYVPDRTVITNLDRRSLPGTLAVFAQGIGMDSNVTAYIKMFNNDTGSYYCQELSMVSTYFDAVDTKSNVLLSVSGNNNPVLPGQSTTRICGSITFQTQTNQFNSMQAIQLTQGLDAIYVCPNFTDADIQSSDGGLAKTIEDAYFSAGIGTEITLCSDHAHNMSQCLNINKGVQIVGEDPDSRSVITCEQCCCVFNIHDENANDTLLENLKLMEDVQNVGSDNCCYPAAIQIAADSSGHAKVGYLEAHIKNITLNNNMIVNFKHAIRIGNAFNVTVSNGEIDRTEGAILLLHGITKALSQFHPLWEAYTKNTSLASDTYFIIFNNNITNTSIGVSNIDLHESAPTAACREFAKNDDFTSFDSVYVPPWNISSNVFTEVNTGITFKGVSAFTAFPLHIVNNNFTDNDQGVVVSDEADEEPTEVGNIPAYTSSQIASLVLESNNVLVHGNYFGTNQDVILYGRNLKFDNNSISDADIRLDPTNSKMLTSARGGFPISNITVSNNNFCLGNLTSALIHQILHVASTLESASVGSYGYYQLNFTGNSIASLYHIFPGRDSVGFSLNINSSSNINCAGNLLDPDRASGQFISPPSSNSSSIQSHSTLWTPVQRKAIVRNGVTRKSSFSGFENDTISTCPDGYQPTPDLKGCEKCTVIEIGVNGVAVDLRRITGCIIFNMTLPPTKVPGAPWAVPWWALFIIVVVSVVIFGIIVCYMYKWSNESPAPITIIQQQPPPPPPQAPSPRENISQASARKTRKVNPASSNLIRRNNTHTYSSEKDELLDVHIDVASAIRSNDPVVRQYSDHSSSDETYQM
jgi:hypothetical protein